MHHFDNTSLHGNDCYVSCTNIKLNSKHNPSLTLASKLSIGWGIWQLCNLNIFSHKICFYWCSNITTVLCYTCNSSLTVASCCTYSSGAPRDARPISWENWAKLGSQNRGTWPSSSWQTSGSGVYIGLEPWRIYWVEWNTRNASPARKSRDDSRPEGKRVMILCRSGVW